MADPQNNFEQLVDVYATEAQAIETMLASILLTAHTDPADPLIVGQQLDGIGQIVGLARQGLSDADYRPRLRAQILVNRSNGTPPDVIGMVEAYLLGVSTVTYVSEDGTIPAGFEIVADDPIPAGTGVQLGLAVRATKAAGVNGYVIYQEDVDAGTFAFDGFSSATFDSGGFGFRGAAG